MENTELTFGAAAVKGIAAGSENQSVIKIKQQYADILDTLNDLRNDPHTSTALKRHASAAITDNETALIRAVTALNWVEI